MMKPLRRFFGFALYLFISLPLLLGSMTMISVRPWLTDPEAYKALVEDQRFTTLLEAPELSQHAPPTMDFGGYRFNGPAATVAFQKAVPPSALVRTAAQSIDTIFLSLESGTSGLTIDLQPWRNLMLGGSESFAAAYLAEAGTAPVPIPETSSPPKSLSPVPATGQQTAPAAIPATGLSQAGLTKLLTDLAMDIPPKFAIDDPSLDTEGRRIPGLTTIRKGFNSASLWLALSAAGLTVAATFIAEASWRRRLKILGSRILGPGIPILVAGLFPYLFNPAGFTRLAGASAMNQFPALMDYLRFAATSLGAGFLITGLAAVGIGTALVSASHFIAPEDEDPEELS